MLTKSNIKPTGKNRYKGDNIFCLGCEEWLNKSNFSIRRRYNKEFYRENCTECHKNKNIKSRRDTRRDSRINGDYVYFIKYRRDSIKAQAKNRNLEFNLSVEYLTQLWEEQDGKCYYTNIKMDNSAVVDAAVWSSPSLDRIDNSKGYIENNVKWALNCINSFKSQMSVEQFKSVIESANWWFNVK